MSSTQKSSLTLYRSLMKAAKGFKDYNWRDHAARRIKYEFTANRSVPAADVPALLTHGRTELASLQRQVLVTNLYHAGTSFVDTPEAKKLLAKPL